MSCDHQISKHVFSWVRMEVVTADMARKRVTWYEWTQLTFTRLIGNTRVWLMPWSNRWSMFRDEVFFMPIGPHGENYTGNLYYYWWSLNFCWSRRLAACHVGTMSLNALNILFQSAVSWSTWGTGDPSLNSWHMWWISDIVHSVNSALKEFWLWVTSSLRWSAKGRLK